MKVYKFFQNKGKEYRLSIEFHTRLLSTDVLWSLAVDVREVGKRKWRPLVMPEQENGPSVHNGSTEYFKHNRWMYRQVPHAWWSETFLEVASKMEGLWQTFQNNMSNNKK